MRKLTSHERLMRIFRGEEIDRPALKLWGAPYKVGWLLHEDYRPVSQLASEITDIFGYGGGYGLNLMVGKAPSDFIETVDEPTGDPEWIDRRTILHTPKGDLCMKRRISLAGDPGYDLEHYIKEPEDIEKMLSIPYEAPPVPGKEEYENAVAAVGDRGIAMIDLPEPGYFVQTLMGSETIAYLSVDDRELVDAMCETYARRLYAHVKGFLDAGLKEPIVGWCGPEVFIPPLMGPKDFDDFVYRWDKPVCDLVHEHGGHFWVHCHGKVKNFIDRFIEMGVDVLNPLEPGPNGDIVMKETAEDYAGRIGLEGNIEIQEILCSSKERIAALIDECVEAGAPSGRMILCPSAGYMEYARPTKRFIENLLFYLDYGLKTVEKYRR